jgi:hypothetical protein
MPAAVDVTPGRWSEMSVLFDNGWYSVTWGRFDGQNHKDLGVRWNGQGNNDKGFPNSRGYPQWYVEPPFLHEGVLLSLKAELQKMDPNSQTARYLKNVDIALYEARQQAGAT